MRQKVILKNLFEESTVQFQPDKICPHVCLWRIHFDIWQNQYNIVKFKNKIKLKKKKKEKKNKRRKKNFNCMIHLKGRIVPVVLRRGK